MNTHNIIFLFNVWIIISNNSKLVQENFKPHLKPDISDKILSVLRDFSQIQIESSISINIFEFFCQAG